MKRGKNTPKKLISLALFILGLSALTFSVFYNSSILAFIGLGLTFWGALTLYIAPEEYVKQTLLDSTLFSSLIALNYILKDLNYQGKAIYLPPKYFKTFETTKVYLPKTLKNKLPTPEEIQREEDKTILKNPDAALITPTGLTLSKLFEETLGTSFTKVDLQYLQQNLPKLLIEDLEIAEDVEVQIKTSKSARKLDDSINIFRLEDNTVYVKITNSIYQDIYKQEKDLPYIHSKIGCPLCSAIACALAKATGKPVTIEKTQTSPDGKTLETYYRIIEPTEPTEEIPKPTAQILQVTSQLANRLAKATSLILTAFGSTILAWIAWLTWYDTTIWGKDLALIFLGSRTGEAISLGIGMKVIYYFLIGLILLVIGLLLLRRSRRRSTQIRE